MISIRPWCNIFHVASTIIIFASFIIPSTHPLQFNFGTFKPSMQELGYEGDAYSDKQSLQLTVNELGKAQVSSLGRAYYSNPVRLWRKSTGELANFTTRFTFAMYAKDQNDAGDGLAFFLAQNGSVPPQSGGGNLGLFPPTPSSPISPTVAVEFDTYRNPWDPYSINDHVGIDVDSIVSKATMAWPTSMKNGSTESALVSYDSMSKNLSVSLAFEDDPVDTTLRTLSYSLDLRDVLQEVVFVGFSAATGESAESHKVLSWEFDSTDLREERVELEGPAPPVPALALAPLPSSVNYYYKKNVRKIAMAVFVIIV